ncbi:uncharacterized protein LOC112555320 [Pomacea canaliculata]|uniref:uncharacterized protein LOC112555320 n=1 Tax=Pomacea canaliculata TaxID=400727 RepID=UPI000D72F574|nr:uncharacterized protein LOC112555320 [Pomacea canaliculata]
MLTFLRASSRPATRRKLFTGRGMCMTGIRTPPALPYGPADVEEIVHGSAALHNVHDPAARHEAARTVASAVDMEALMGSSGSDSRRKGSGGVPSVMDGEHMLHGAGGHDHDLRQLQFIKSRDEQEEENKKSGWPKTPLRTSTRCLCTETGTVTRTMMQMSDEGRRSPIRISWTWAGRVLVEGGGSQAAVAKERAGVRRLAAGQDLVQGGGAGRVVVGADSRPAEEVPVGLHRQQASGSDRSALGPRKPEMGRRQRGGRRRRRRTGRGRHPSSVGNIRQHCTSEGPPQASKRQAD